MDSSVSFVVVPAQTRQGNLCLLLGSQGDPYARPAVVLRLQMLAACEVVGLREEASFYLLRAMKSSPAGRRDSAPGRIWLERRRKSHKGSVAS